MKCPKCNFENPEAMKFCGECGAKIEKICPTCNFSNPPQFKFCGECGQDISQTSEPKQKELSFDDKIERIQKYLPGGLTERILSQRGKIEGERKQVTVLFADMEGFTTLVEKLDSEEAYSIMDQVYEILIHKVHDYDGTVNEMTGDGIVALFGAPIALEDAPQRAIRSAYAIHREMNRFSTKIKQESEGMPPLKMRIGVHTGPVVVGTLGNDLRVEFKAVGDTVNLASRMENLAEPGATYVTEETFKLTEGIFRFEVIGEKKVKGKEVPVKIYRLIGPSSRRTRFDVSAERGLTPFVGRERELEILLDGFERAKAGQGQAISIVADAGVGKSRLNYEFIKTIMNEDVTILEGKCLSYSSGVAYHPVVDVLKANFDIQDADGDFEIKDKVKRRIERLGFDEVNNLPYILDLLSVDNSGLDKVGLSPETKKYRLFEAVKRIVIKGSEIRPLVISIEDLHWIDRSSEDIFKNLLDSIATTRVLLIFTYRTDFLQTWGGKSYHSQIHLNRFANRESLSMMSYLLGTEDIDKDLEQLILEKTEGVPFFIEEFIKSLKDLDYIEQKTGKYSLSKNKETLTIPSTIHDVIMARVDSLPVGAKEVLQAGSAIEREFSHEMIVKVSGLAELELLSHISILKDSELIYERGVFPQSHYIFKHALTKEVVYESILERGKKVLHGKIAEAIEDIYKETLAENYGILANHFIKGENYTKGSKYAERAAGRYYSSGSFYIAAEYFKKAVSCIERLPQSDDNDIQLINLRCTLANCYRMVNFFGDAKEAIDPIIKLAEDYRYKQGLAQIYEHLGTYYYFIETDLEKALEHLDKAIKISSEIKNYEVMIFCFHWYGLCLTYDCQFERAISYLKRILDIPEIPPTFVAMSTSAFSSFAYSWSGKVNEGYEKSKEALRITDDLDDMGLKSFVYIGYGWCCFCKGFLEEPITYLLEGLSFDEQMNSFFLAGNKALILGEMFYHKNMYEKSLYYFSKANSYFEGIQANPHFIIWVELVNDRSNTIMGKRDIKTDILTEKSHEYIMPNFLGFFQRIKSEALLNMGESRYTEAEIWFKQAIETDTKNGARFSLGLDHASYSQLLFRKGDKSKCKENLNKAIEIFDECGADGWVERFKKEMTQL